MHHRSRLDTNCVLRRLNYSLFAPHSVASCAALALACSALAQPAPQPGRTPGAPRGPFPPQVTSPEVSLDRHITFRILASNAPNVRLMAGDIPGQGMGKDMTKGTNGVWEATIGPIDPGAYRYQFSIDGVSVIDPRNPAGSESINNLWSLVNVPGSDFMDTKEVPHGAVSAVTYYSTTLKRFRRLHIYTPPRYELGHGKYPVFYLLHGAGDSDDSWTSVGRAGFILDNLIAAKKAKPMIIVMPAGHTRAFGGFGARTGAPGGDAAARPPVDEFTQDFLADIIPAVETRYRVYKDASHRAIAGLSMGGSQTLNIAVPHLDKFGYVGVFSSGLIGSFGGRGGAGAAAAPQGPTWEERHLAELDNTKLKKGLKLLWFCTGTDDFLIDTTRRTVGMFQKHGFALVAIESAGGHTWINWRNYLKDFAPQLYQ